jgi:hypothetical protein
MQMRIFPSIQTYVIVEQYPLYRVLNKTDSAVSTIYYYIK